MRPTDPRTDEPNTENNSIENQATNNLSGSWQSAASVLVRGNNPGDFLQGYVTSDLARLGSTKTVPMALCNLKGRVIVSGWVHHIEEDGLALVVHKTLAVKLCETLTPYARFSRCELSVATDHPQVTTDHDTGFLDTLCFTTSADQACKDISTAMNTRLIAHGIAFISVENSEKYLPQVLNLHNHGFVDFDKGCYLGQEIVARAQFRGQVKKTIKTFSWTTSMPSVGDTIDAGTVIAAASAETSNVGVGLAVA
ncbi:MAG: hypothetical protein P8L31_09760 [Pseudomonadales bacterium]|nr:hypothetical protein [Pseudomonadales bacterium]